MGRELLAYLVMQMQLELCLGSEISAYNGFFTSLTKSAIAVANQDTDCNYDWEYDKTATDGGCVELEHVEATRVLLNLRLGNQGGTGAPQ